MRLAFLSIASATIVASAALAACSTPSGVDAGDASDAVANADTLMDGPDGHADARSDAAADAFGDAPGDASNDSPSDARVCPSAIAPDPLATARAACTFATGATVADTLGLSDAARSAIPIRHVLVVMKENRSFDQLLGQLHDHGQPGVDAIPPTFQNSDLTGATVRPFHQTSTCYVGDPGHQWSNMHAQVDGGAMDGFVTSAANTAGGNGHFAMGYYDASDLPFYYWLASTFAINDHHFASVRSGTYPNRNFLALATADGVMSTGSGFPNASTPTIFDELDAAGVTWGVYTDGSPFSGSLGWTASTPGVHTFASLLTALDDGSLPSVSFVDGIDNIEDEHPDANVQQGEAWTRNIYEHAVQSALWPGLAMIWTYDEAGGFFDHVPPPDNGCIARPIALDQPYFELGVRVPLAVVSPWARANYVSHAVEEHTAITRFIEAVFGLPALTARDGNSGALLDLFDFDCPPALMTPPAAPPAGTHGCHGGCTLTLDQPTYHAGDAIHATFAGCPGNNPIDWIGIYPYTAGTPTLPLRGSTVWAYLGGTHTGTTMPTGGTVTLNASNVGRGPWPLTPGGYSAYYLLNDGYVMVTSVDFTVVP